MYYSNHFCISLFQEPSNFRLISSKMRQIRTILFEGIERHIIFINKFFYNFFQWLETWSIICIICPTLFNYFGQFCRTNCWNSQMTSFMANNIFNLIVVFFSIIEKNNSSITMRYSKTPFSVDFCHKNLPSMWNRTIWGHLGK